MNINFIYGKEIKKNNDKFKIYFEGNTKNQSIDCVSVKKICDRYFNNISFDEDIINFVGDIKTLFREFNESKLSIVFNNKNNEYTLIYKDGKLIDYTCKNNTNEIKNTFTYDSKFGINFNIIDNYIKFNSSYDNIYNKLYLNNMKKIYELQNISINKIPNEIYYINELYKLFYGKYPNYNKKNINEEINLLVYILSEYRVSISDKYNFNNLNDKKIPLSQNLNNDINCVKPYDNIVSDKNIIIDKKTKEIVKIIKETVNNNRGTDSAFLSALIYLCSVIYATKYNLSLGFTTEKVMECLNYNEIEAEKGIKLLKLVNRNIYEKD